MRLGIDFGTTRIVVAVADRGNYPVVSFETADGAFDWFPPLIALSSDKRIYGWEAWAAQSDSQWTIIRSVKRVLEDAGADTELEAGSGRVAITGLLTDLCSALREHLVKRSSLGAAAGEPLEAMLGVPANANSNQRFLTVDAFRRAGFNVLGLLNEPSAASIEYGHRRRGTSTGTSRILVYDFGGGTFDASLVEVADKTHSVVASLGISTLGGDDFDEILAEMALEAAGPIAPELTAAETFRLQEECRAQKETLNPNSRKMVIDLGVAREGLAETTVPVSEFYAKSRPLLDESIRVVDELLDAHGADDLEALYLTGGASELPLVARVLRERFGRKVKRSSYTRSATAIGLAIQADAQSGYVLHERFTRNFGVWREGDGGRRMIFDVLFPRGTKLPGPDEAPLENARRYSPVHNIGHFRYLEASQVSDDGQPAGDVTIWDEILFPFDPALAGADLSGAAVAHFYGERQHIEERFSCDAGGTVTVTISNLSARYSREYRLGRWSSQHAVVSPGKPRRATAKGKARAAK